MPQLRCDNRQGERGIIELVTISNIRVLINTNLISAVYEKDVDTTTVFIGSSDRPFYIKGSYDGVIKKIYARADKEKKEE